MKRIESRTVKPPKPVILWVDTDGSHLYDWHDDELSPETRQRAVKNGYRRIRYVPLNGSDTAKLAKYERALRRIARIEIADATGDDWPWVRLARRALGTR